MTKIIDASVEDLAKALSKVMGNTNTFGGINYDDEYSFEKANDLRKQKDEIDKKIKELEEKTEELKNRKIELATNGELDKLAEVNEELNAINGQLNLLRNQRINLVNNINGGNSLKSVTNDLSIAVSKIKDFYSTVKSLDDPWAKADHAASKFTKTVGGTKAAMDALRSNTIDNVAKGIATNFNVSMEELVKAQTDYINGIGRNISIDNVAKESLAAIASFSESTGIDGLGLAAQFENFGIGIEKTGDHLGKRVV